MITKTKEFLSVLKNLNLNADAKILVVLSTANKQLWLATRNLKNIDLTVATCLNIKQLLNTNHIILSNSTLELINSTYGKHYA
jgi:large subunit ribosomal protein L4